MHYDLRIYSLGAVIISPLLHESAGVSRELIRSTFNPLAHGTLSTTDGHASWLQTSNRRHIILKAIDFKTRNSYGDPQFIRYHKLLKGYKRPRK